VKKIDETRRSSNGGRYGAGKMYERKMEKEEEEGNTLGLSTREEPS